MIQEHRLREWFLAGFLCFCLVSAARGLDPAKPLSQYVRERWGSERGFLGGAIYAIGQSNDGYLWIGTERGLVRFDGFHFTLLQEPIPSGRPIGPVRGLVSDAEGNLWIRLDGTRLLRYRDGRFDDVSARFDLGETSFTAMAPDGAGGLLLSGLGSRTLRYHGGKIETIADSTEIAGTVISLARTRDQRVWMGTRDDGLFRVEGGKFSRASAEFANRKINALTPARSGGLWIGTESGIRFLDESGRIAVNLPSSISHFQTFAMILDHDANLWAGTDHGLIRITRDGAVSLDQGQRGSGNVVTAVFEDRDNDLWIGDSEGIERLRDGMFTTYSTADGLPATNNGPVYADSEGRTWFAPVSGGLYWLKNGQVGRVSTAGLGDDVVYSISGGGGEIWAGRQRGGLTLLTRSGDSFIARTYSNADGLAQNTVFAVHRARDGSVWAGTVSAGVSRLKDGVFKSYSVSDGLASNAINSMVEGFDGTIWLGTPSGLSSFSNGHWVNRGVQDGLPSADVRTIFEDSKHGLWIATSGGLAFLSSGHPGVPRNLPESLREQIFGIAEDGLGHLWFATSDHVVRVNRDQLLAGSLDDSDVQTYGLADGLERIEGVRRDRSMVADPLGRVWVSLSHGLAVADPKLALSAAPVNVRIESMMANGVEVNRDGSPKVAAGSRSISFVFAGTSLATPERIRFRYKLDGSDQGWSNAVETKQVIYRNLNPGPYCFHVIASNGEGLWNGQEIRVPFLIEPTFWQTWWFRILCLTVFGLTLLALFRLRMRRFTRQLDVLYKERLDERTRIAQELHDTLLQSFQGLMLRFQTVNEMLPKRPDDAKLALEGALDRADQALSESRDAIKDIRSSETSSPDLAHEMNALMTRLSKEAGPSNGNAPAFDVIVVGTPQTVRPILRAEILRIAREALRNAFSHAHASRIETEITYDQHLLRLRLRDDGVGIDARILERGGRTGHWGLVGMDERARRISGHLDIWSKLGAGTEVELRLPGHIAYEALPARATFRIFRRKAEQNHDHKP